MLTAAPSIRRMPTVVGGGSTGPMQIVFGSYGLADATAIAVGSGSINYSANHGNASQALVGLRLTGLSANRIHKIGIRINGVVKAVDIPANLLIRGGWFDIFVPLDIPSGALVETGWGTNASAQTADVYVQGAAAASPIGVSYIGAPPGSQTGIINGQGASITPDGTTNWSAWTPIGTALTAAAKGIATAHIAQANANSGRTAARIWAEFGFGPDAANITPLIGNVLGNNLTTSLQGIDAGPVFKDIPSGSIIHFRAKTSISLSGAENPISGQVAVMYP